MKITYIAAGAGQMYCGACARDMNLINGLMELGHDVTVIPLYTPLRHDGQLPETTPVFYGGINVFLQQMSGIFRYLPRFVDRVLDKPSLLNWASGFAIETKPAKLGPMTISVLSGKDGRQRKELSRLLDYLEDVENPDVIGITNSLLSGIAPEIKSRLKVPIVCSLQGEDSFIEAMPETYRNRAQKLMMKNAESIDLFIAPGDGYSSKMREFLGVSSEKIKVVRAGIDVKPYKRTSNRTTDPFVIGFLSSIIPNKGLDLLVDAVGELVNNRRKQIKLRIAGKVLNQGYWNDVQSKINALGIEPAVEYLGEVDLAEKVQFLHSCSVFSVPSRIPESRGMAVMEAMAAGIPVVVPYSGIFPEMMAMTGGGLTFESENPTAIADAIVRLMDNPKVADTMGESAAHGIAEHFSSVQMAEATISAFVSLR